MATANFVDEADHQQTLIKTLYTAAWDALARGWSVLPLIGFLNPRFTKLPAISSWKYLQQQQPSATDVQRWFFEFGYQGLGVICGRISGLLVFDFDSAERADDFVRQFPHLANTYTVRSGMRGLPHFYFSIADDVPSTGWSVSGLDVRGDGQYVAAPPTPSASGGWQVINDAPLQTLNFGDFSAVYDFFNPTPHQPLKIEKKSAFESFAAPSENTSSESAASQLSSAGLSAYYRTLAPDRGRNNALFSAARLARDSGWSQMQTELCLTPLHIAQPANQGHLPETPDQRLREAHRTIASVYSRPARPRLSTRPVSGLPNALREHLLNAGVQTTAAARLLDALFASGWQPGRTFSEREACEQVQPFGIGRRSVRAALAAILADTKIFAVAATVVATTADQPLAGASPSPAPLPAAGAATGVAVETNKCFVGRASERVKSGRGRPAVHFVLPSPLALCERVGIEPHASDPLEHGDFAHPACYRRAQHRALLARRPGQYGRSWLAARLGVSLQTARRYDRQLGVQVQPVFAQSSITRLNAHVLASSPANPSELADGVFLEAADGRRYPALQGVARRLLKQGCALVLKRQLPNYYSLSIYKGPVDPLSQHSVRSSSAVHAMPLSGSPSSRPAAPQPDMGPIDPLYVRSLAEAARQLTNPLSAGSTMPVPEHRSVVSRQFQTPSGADADMGPIDPLLPSDSQTGSSSRPIVIVLDSTPKAPRAPRSFHEPLPDSTQEALAQRICATTRAINPRRPLSQSTARQLVSTYTHFAIQRALRTLAARRSIESPAGFLITVLRSETGITFTPRKSRRKPKRHESRQQQPQTPQALPVAAPQSSDDHDPLRVYVDPQTGRYDPAAHQRALTAAAIERSRHALQQRQQQAAESPYAHFIKQPPPTWTPPDSLQDLPND